MDSIETHVEIDLDAIAHNITSLKGLTRDGTRFMAVVKADAYGHGAVPVARTAINCGADELAVSRFHEACALREAGIETPILIFSTVAPEHTCDMIRLDLRASVNSLSLAEAYSRKADESGRKLKVHIKIDTGMGRMGLLWNGASVEDQRLLDTIVKIINLPGIVAEGIYTHFAHADAADKTHAEKQLDRFQALLDRLKKIGVEFPLRHAANSAALIEMPATHFDMVRPGISIYGYYPGKDTDRSLVLLKPAMTLKSNIIQIKEVDAGFTVSYGCTYRTSKKSRIATIALGYADGYHRLLSSRGHMLVHGRRAPVLGRVCMDLTMIDITDIDGVRIGDEVVAFGCQAEARLHVDEVADLIGTISYEVVCGINHRVPRIYLNA